MAQLKFSWSIIFWMISKRSCCLTKKKEEWLYSFSNTAYNSICTLLQFTQHYWLFCATELSTPQRTNMRYLQKNVEKYYKRKKNWWNIPYNWGLLIIFCYNFISYSSEKRDLCYDEISSSINILYFWGRCVSHFSRSNLKIRLGNAQKKNLVKLKCVHLFSLDSIYILKGGNEEARRGGGRKGRQKSLKLRCSNTFFFREINFTKHFVKMFFSTISWRKIFQKICSHHSHYCKIIRDGQEH